MGTLKMFLFSFKDMDIEEMQDVAEEMYVKEEKKLIKDEKPRARSKSRSR